jgi:hypothetical protein
MDFGALLSALPALPEDAGEELPITLDQFWWRASMEGDPALTELVGAVLMMRGVINILMALEGKEPSYFATLNRAEVQAPTFYPEFAQTVNVDGGASAEVADQLWERYFEYALGIADEYGCDLLSTALRWEIGFRNALAIRRASTLGLDAAKYTVVEDQGVPVEEFAPWLDGVNVAEDDPVAVERALAQLRLDRLNEVQPWASTAQDAVVEYALRLLVLKHSSVLVAKEHAE